MTEFTNWRGYDLRARRAKIECAFRLEPITSFDNIPLIINTPCDFAFAGEHMPEDDFIRPASIVEYQATGFEAHLSRVNDDTMPYLMPWFGTGVLASGFGCQIKISPGLGNDPRRSRTLCDFTAGCGLPQIARPAPGWLDAMCPGDD